jgi:Ribonuclease G/E
VTAPAPLVRAVVEDTGLGLRAAVLEGGRLVELREEEAGPDERRVTDALFLARVTGVEPRLDGGFLDCGLGERVQGFIAAPRSPPPQRPPPPRPGSPSGGRCGSSCARASG